jgi:hypothetical protein
MAEEPAIVYRTCCRKSLLPVHHRCKARRKFASVTTGKCGRLIILSQITDCNQLVQSNPVFDVKYTSGDMNWCEQYNTVRQSTVACSTSRFAVQILFLTTVTMATSPDEPTLVEFFRQEKNELFEQNHRVRRRSAAASNATASEAAAIQQSLSRTQKLLQAELARVAAVQTAIEGDERLLRETMHTHKTLNVAGAKKALTELERAEQKERRVLAASILFFWSSVFYVVWCRILSRIPFLDRLVNMIPIILEWLLHLMAFVHEKITKI